MLYVLAGFSLNCSYCLYMHCEFHSDDVNVFFEEYLSNASLNRALYKKFCLCLHLWNEDESSNAVVVQVNPSSALVP